MHSYPDNFLSQEIKALELLWGFDTNQIISNYTGSKLVPKESQKIESNLNQSTWHLYKENTHPTPIPRNIYNPSPDLLKLRFNILFPFNWNMLFECLFFGLFSMSVRMG